MPLPRKGDDRTLPACTKTLLFRFAGLHGAGSELSLALRVGALASHFGYTLLLDSSSWNYGSLESYFLPFPPLIPSTHDECRPPPSTTKRSKLVLSPADSASLQSLLSSSQDPRAFGWVPAWTSRNHLVWHQRDMDGLDQTILALFTSAPDLEAMHDRDLEELKTGTKGRIGGLEPRATVPEVFREVFERLAKEAARVWRVNEEVEGSVKALEERLGFGRRAGRGTQGEGKEAGDLVVGVHVRLGDKYLEADRIGPQILASASPSSLDSPLAPAPPSPYSHFYTAQPGLHDVHLTSYYAAAVQAVNDLLPSPSSGARSVPSEDSTPEEQVGHLLAASSAWDGRPTLVLMSDDPAAVEAFRRHPIAGRFRVVGTVEDGEEVVPSSSPSEREALEEEEQERDESKQVVQLPDLREGEKEDSAAEDLPGLVDAVDGQAPPARWKKVFRRQNHGAGKVRLGHHVVADGWTKVQAQGQGQGLSDGQREGGGGQEGPGRKPLIPAGFNENAFNALPLSTRIAQTRLFVRDVTVLTTRADALVVTGSSNVGRLMALLMGERAREGRGGGRVRSLDTRWFPTARFS
ncbi:hypothetical protein JCM1841_003910 [Sporobolomyces salmonicolor]